MDLIAGVPLTEWKLPGAISGIRRENEKLQALVRVMPASAERQGNARDYRISVSCSIVPKT